MINFEEIDPVYLTQFKDHTIYTYGTIPHGIPYQFCFCVCVYVCRGWVPGLLKNKPMVRKQKCTKEVGTVALVVSKQEKMDSEKTGSTWGERHRDREHSPPRVWSGL